MSTDNLDILIGGGWRKDVADFRKAVDSIVGDMDRLNAKSKSLEISFNTDSDSISKHKKNTKELIDLQQQYVTTTGNVKKSLDGLAEKRSSVLALDAKEVKSKRDIIKAYRELIQEQSKLEAAIAKEEAAVKKKQSAYAALSAEYVKAAATAKDLATMHGVESEAAKKAAASAIELHKRLLAIDESVGQSQRNVGNYKSHWNGLGMSIQQISRELPNFAQNIQTGFLAISNNLPMLADEIRRVKIENADLVKQGKPTVSVFKQIAASIFSWQTALVAVIALSVAYGKAFVNMLQGKTAAMLEAEKANKKYKESLEEIERTSAANTAQEIARLNVLVATAQSTAQATDTRLAAVQKLQTEFPKYFAALDREIILQGDVKAATDAATESIIKQGLASTAFSQFEEASKKDFTNIKNQEKALKEYNEYVGKFDKATQNAIVKQELLWTRLRQMNTGDLTKQGFGFSDEAAKLTEESRKNLDLLFKKGVDPNKITALQKNLSELHKIRQMSQSEVRDMLDSYKKYSEEVAGDLLGDSSPSGSIAALDAQINGLKQQRDLLQDTTEGRKKEAELTKEIIKLEDELAKRRRTGKYSPNHKAPGVSSMTNEEIAGERLFTKEVFQQVEERANFEAKKQKAIADNEALSLEDRLTAYRVYLKEKEKADAAVLDSDWMQTTLMLDKIKELEEKQGKGATLGNEDKALLEKKEGLLKHLQLVEDSYLELSTLSNIEYSKGIETIYEQSVSLRLAQLNNLYANVTEQEAAAQRELLAEYQKGEMSFTEYKKRESDISAKYSKEKHQQAIDYLQEEIDALAKQGVNVTSLQKALNDEKKALYEEDRRNFETNEQRKLEFIQNVNSLIWQLGQETAKALQDYQQQQYAKEIEQHEKKISDIDEALKIELLSIKLKATSKLEYDQMVLDAEAAAFAKKKQQEAEIARIKRKAALADKAAAILGIVANTAQAVAKQFKDYPFPYALIPAGLVAALGAVQVAAVASKPLPAYEKGTKSKPTSGPAIVGEKGAELYRLPSGDWGITPAVATVMSFPQGTEIITADKSNKMIKAAIETKGVPDTAKQKYYSDQLQAQAINAMSNKIVKAIQSQKPIRLEGVSASKADYIKYKQYN